MTIVPTGYLPQPAYRHPHVHDQWAPLSHAIGNGVGDPLHVPGVGVWVPFGERRRLLAYLYLEALADNVRRYWLPRHMWWPGPIDENDPGPHFPPALQYREYGTTGNLIDSGQSLVLGEEQRIRVPGAEPAPGGAGQPAATGLAVAAQAWLDEWVTDERLFGKMISTERRVLKLGDSILTVAWSDQAGRPRLVAYHPGFYFPDWALGESPQYKQAGWDDPDFPARVHLAWEEEEPDGTSMVRRSTWTMVQLPAKRNLPYGGSSDWTCIYEEVLVDVGRATGDTVHDWAGRGNGVTQVMPPTDLGVDFLPVVHVPNTEPGENLYGDSLFLRVAQLLDDISSGDTDLAINAETVAGAKLVTKNATETPKGTWLSMFEDGDAKILDTSHTLDALLRQSSNLRQLLARNTRLGQILLGMVAPNEVPSGYAMRLGFASASALERELTQLRQEKWGLAAKMVLRFAQANGLVPAGETPRVLVELGRGLPVDRAAVIEEVATLLAVKAISTLTAVLMLQEAGLPVDDARAEVERIQAESPDKAVQILDATGDEQATRDYLGLKGPGPQPPVKPTPTPPAGGGEPAPPIEPGASGLQGGNGLPPVDRLVRPGQTQGR